MKFDTKKRLAVLSLFLSPVALFGGVEVAKGELFAKGTVRMEHDSNVYANNSEKGDFVFVGTPEVGYTREAGWIRLDANAGVAIQRYGDYTDDNSENPFGQVFVGWVQNEGKSDGRFLASARKTTAANEVVNSITESNDYMLDAAVGHFATEKLGYRVKATYGENDYKTAGMSDLRKLMGGIDGRFQYSPKMEVFVGYAFRENTIFNRANKLADIKSNDNQFQVGVEGELAPKLKGRIGVGLVTRDYKKNALKDQNGLLLDSSVTWKYSELGSVKVFLNDDLDNSPIDQSIRRLSGGFDATHLFSPKIEFGGGITYSHESYSGVFGSRVDDAVAVQTRVTYKFTPFVSASLYINYRNADSTLAYSDYQRSNVGVTVTAKF